MIFTLLAITLVLDLPPQYEPLPVGAYARGGRLAWKNLSGGIACPAYAPKKGIIAYAGKDWAGSRDTYIYLFTFPQCRFLERIKAHDKTLYALAFSESGKLLASTDDNGVISVWDVAGRKELFRLRQRGEPIHSLCFSPNEKLLASGNAKGEIYLWDLRNPKEEKIIRAHGWIIHGLAFHPDGLVLASGGSENVVRLWDVRSRKLIKEMKGDEDDMISRVIFSPDKQTLIAADWDGKIRAWDISTGKVARVLRHEGIIWSLALSADGRYLASGNSSRNPEARVWDLVSGKELCSIGHRGSIHSVMLDESGAFLVTQTSHGDIGIWDSRTGRKLNRAPGHEGEVHCICFSPDGRTLASGGTGTVLWSTDRGRQITAFPAEFATALAFSPKGDKVFVADWDTIRIVDTKNGKVLARLEGHTTAVNSLHVLSDKVLVSSAADKTIRMWDVETTKEIDVIRRENYVDCLSADGKKLAVGGEGTIVIFDTASWKLQSVLARGFDIYWCLNFSKDGKELATGGRAGVINIWDLGTGRVRRTIQGSDWEIGALAFSPDGKYIFAGDSKGEIAAWDSASGKQIKRCLCHQLGVLGLSFSPDGSRFVTCSRDRTVLFWNVQEFLGKGTTP